MSLESVLHRRDFLRAMLTLSAPLTLLDPSSAQALGRLPVGGRVAMVVPWPLRRLDPHQLGDIPAALFGASISDTLFGSDSRGTPFPTLALQLPSREGGASRLQLRPGLVTAHGRRLDARDAVASIARSKRRGGISLLAALRDVRADKKDPLSLLITGPTPEELARRLSSPLVALLPRGYSPLRPDGTGAFRATLQRDYLRLDRNTDSARGPALLDRIDVRSAKSLRDALRSFEVGESDLGWLGRGLYRERKDSTPLDGGTFGWVVLRTGKEAGHWGAPGVAQQLADALDDERMLHLGVAAGEKPGTTARWGGPKSTISVDGTAPQLVQIAESVAEQLGSPGHELRVLPLGRAELSRARQSGQFALLVDAVRSPGSTALSPQYALLGASNRQLAANPPSIAPTDVRVITRTLTLGVIGELRILGATASALRGIGDWDLGSAWRKQ